MAALGCNGLSGLGQNASANAQQVGQKDAPPVGRVAGRFFNQGSGLRLGSQRGAPLTVTLGGLGSWGFLFRCQTVGFVWRAGRWRVSGFLCGLDLSLSSVWCGLCILACSVRGLRVLAALFRLRHFRNVGRPAFLAVWLRFPGWRPGCRTGSRRRLRGFTAGWFCRCRLSVRAVYSGLFRGHSSGCGGWSGAGGVTAFPCGGLGSASSLPGCPDWGLCRCLQAVGVGFWFCRLAACRGCAVPARFGGAGHGVLSSSPTSRSKGRAAVGDFEVWFFIKVWWLGFAFVSGGLYG